MHIFCQLRDVDIFEAVEVRGIAPRGFWVMSQFQHYATPTALKLYQGQLGIHIIKTMALFVAAISAISMPQGKTIKH
jgi:hypothetical protein